VGYRLVTAARHLSRLADRMRLTDFMLLAVCEWAVACCRASIPQALRVIANTITAAAVLVTVQPFRGSPRLIALMAREHSVT